MRGGGALAHSGSRWLVWKYEGQWTLAEALDGALGQFPYCLEDETEQVWGLCGAGVRGVAYMGCTCKRWVIRCMEDETVKVCGVCGAGVGGVADKGGRVQAMPGGRDGAGVGGGLLRGAGMKG